MRIEIGNQQNNIPLNAQTWNSTPAHERIVQNLPLAKHLAIRWATNRGFPSSDIDDAIQHASIALMRADKIFDPSKGFTFSTLAAICIHKELNRMAAKNMHRLECNIRRVSLEASEMTEEIEDEVDISLLNRAISLLDKREQDIIHYRYGLRGNQSAMFRPLIAKLLHITGERVRQIENKAIIKLRRYMRRIDRFDGKYWFLSNFFPSTVAMGNITFPTVEHAYQAAKTIDREQKLKIAQLATPAQAKRAGKKLEIRLDWESIKLQVMEDCVKHKFTRHPELRDDLLRTNDDYLEEGNWWGDCFWGVCRGVGENNLGKILMKIRTELQSTLADYCDIPESP